MLLSYDERLFIPDVINEACDCTDICCFVYWELEPSEAQSFTLLYICFCINVCFCWSAWARLVFWAQNYYCVGYYWCWLALLFLYKWWSERGRVECESSWSVWSFAIVIVALLLWLMLIIIGWLGYWEPSCFPKEVVLLVADCERIGFEIIWGLTTCEVGGLRTWLELLD